MSDKPKLYRVYLERKERRDTRTIYRWADHSLAATEDAPEWMKDRMKYGWEIFADEVPT